MKSPRVRAAKSGWDFRSVGWGTPKGASLVFLILTLIFASACTRGSGSRTTIEFWGLGREGEVVASMIPEFERRNPGIHVIVQQIPWTAAHEKLLTAYVGESTPDVAQMGNTWIPEMVALHAVDDLTGLAGGSTTIDERDYFPGIWATNVVNGRLYGIPWYVDTRVVFYRSDILAAVGYPEGPKTWEQWLDAMNRIVKEKRANFAILAPTNEWEPIAVLALSNHSSILNPKGTEGVFEEPPFRQAFTFYLDLFRKGFAPKVSNLQVANLYQQFASADFAMYITGPWNVGESGGGSRRRWRGSGRRRRSRRRGRVSRWGSRWRAARVWCFFEDRNIPRPPES